MELKGSKTEQNLRTAFAGESQAHTKYLYYASRAKKDGYVQISKIFEETAKNEKEHAKIWFKFLHDGVVPSTEVNLADAADGVHGGREALQHCVEGISPVTPALFIVQQHGLGQLLADAHGRV